MLNGVILWYLLALLHLFHFIRGLFFSIIFFFFFFFFVVKINQLSFFPSFLSGILMGELVINVTGLVQFQKNLRYILPPIAS